MENQPAISSDLIRGHIDTIILHTLLESDKFAQQISDAIESKSENEYKINQATLYSSLKRLETLKLVSSYWHDYDDGRRKFFKITDSGKQTVENNLSSWTYSRSVLDKLMDITSTPVFVNSTAKKVENDDFSVSTVKESKNSTQNDAVTFSNAHVIRETKTEEPIKNTINEEHERNFRTILNGLIQISERSAHTESTQNVIEPLVSIADNAKSDGDVMKFNETIDETDYNANKTNFNGKIDYGDLTLKAEKEGYSVRISSKDSAKPHGNILRNKLNFVTAVLVFITALVEIGILYFIFSNAFNAPSVIVLSAISLVPLLIFAIIYIANRGKLYNGKISADGILTTAIIAFNLILITLAIDFLIEIDFSDTSILLSALILPVIYYLDAVLFFTFRFVLSSRKAFYCK